MDPFGLARRVTAVGMRTVEGALVAPDLVAGLWGEVTDLVGRMHRVLDRVDHLAERVGRELDEVDDLLDRSRGLLGAAGEVNDIAHQTALGARDTRELAEQQLLRVQALLDLYRPVLEALAPVGREAALMLRPGHLRGLARLLDELPSLVDRIEPTLDSVGDVAPHLEDMTDRLENVGQVVEGLPGAKLLKRRGQAREDSSDE